jgi:hypothetical protein
MTASDAAYAGTELETFAGARRWKRYWSAHLRPYLGARVVEVGAGLGSNTAYLNDGSARSWECIEPDAAMRERLRDALRRVELPPNVTVASGPLAQRSGEPVDAVVYVDVLEHIADDRGEVRTAAAQLVVGGRLIVLAPAHTWLFSPFDAAIGHHRRYSRGSLAALAGPELELIKAFYLDSAGLFASLANRWLMRTATPTARQIAFWDGVLVPVSRVVDALTSYRFGKTVVTVWRRR